MSSSLPTTNPSGTHETRKSWREIILEVLRRLPEGPVRLAVLFDAVEEHPDVIARAGTNAHRRAKLRQVLQRLRDEGLVDAVAIGVWTLKSSAR